MRNVSEDTTIQVGPQAVYDAVSDVKRMGRWSPECTGASVSGEGGPAYPGMHFRGHNRKGAVRWWTQCRVTVAEPGECFAFEVRSGGLPISRWTYTLQPDGDATRVTERWDDLRGGVAAAVLSAVSVLLMGVRDRAVRNRETMRVTLDRLKADLEGATV
ncbi:MAG: SRPBCC family protein [Carbonactinosporaceae bacterium]